jgi:hypothetical protein
MTKIEKIAEGYSSLVRSKIGLTTEEEETLFNARRAICRACPFGKGGLLCSKCGCVLSAKTKSINSSCPEKHW